MPLFRHIALRPGVYETAGGRHLRLSADDLARCRENTLRLLARGWRVPVFIGHVEVTSLGGGPRRQPPGDGTRWVGRAPSSTAVGHLVDVTLGPDGALGYELSIRRAYLRKLRRAKLRHTSPEIRPTFRLSPGEAVGPVIAHVALTRRPLCRGQTWLAPVADGADESNDFHHSLSKGNDMSTPAETTLPTADEAVRETTPVAAPDTTPAEQPETDGPGGPSYGTDGLGNPSYDGADRVALAERIRRSRKLPKGLRDRLCEFVETLQLSEDAPGEPVVPVAEAVTMIEAAVPEHLALGDDELEEPRHPRGEDFFRGQSTQISDDEAARIASEQLAASGFGPAA
jgi:hypothetical protein